MEPLRLEFTVACPPERRSVERLAPLGPRFGGTSASDGRP